MRKFIVTTLAILAVVGVLMASPRISKGEMSIPGKCFKEAMILAALADHKFLTQAMMPRHKKTLIDQVYEETLALKYIDEGDNDRLRLPSEIRQRGGGDCDDFAVYFVCRLLYTKYRALTGFILLHAGGRPEHIAPLVFSQKYQTEYIFDRDGIFTLAEYIGELEREEKYEEYEVIYLFPIQVEDLQR